MENTVGVVIELAVINVVLSNLDVTDIKLVFTITVGSHSRLGIC